MTHEGPPLETLLQRIAQVPRDFLPPSDNDPRDRGTPITLALVNDLFEMLGLSPLSPDEQYALFRDAESVTSWRVLVSIICWVLADDWCRDLKHNGLFVAELLGPVAKELSRQASFTRFINDPDRREELARVVLAQFDLRPQGETENQARDRLTSLSSVERRRVLAASRTAEERARAIREALAKKAAEEAADKSSRE